MTKQELKAIQDDAHDFAIALNICATNGEKFILKLCNEIEELKEKVEMLTEKLESQKLYIKALTDVPDNQ